MKDNEVRSIRSTIFRRMVFTVFSAVVLSVAVMLVFVFVSYGKAEKNEIAVTARYEAEYMNKLDTVGEKLDFLRSLYGNTDSRRATLIAENGAVLFDNEVSSDGLENHLSRPEVVKARATGTGAEERSSDTLGERVYYYAVLLNDESVLRVSKPIVEVSKTVISLVPYSLLLIFCIMIITALVSKNTTKQIMTPIYEIDINNLDNSSIYPELRPFFTRMEEENAEKEKTEAIRREFSANVSHELKTPLTSISGYAQMINNGMARHEDIKKFGLKIEKESERLLLLIDDIIRLSNLDETSEITEPEVIKLNETVSETLSNLEPQIEKRGLSVFYSGDESVICGKPTMITELAYNIIDNAIKYNKQGGRMDVYVGKSPGGIEFSVADTGIGIAEEDIDRVFERFYRVDKSHSKTVGGTGLGLSIVKHIVMVHNADITIKSRIGEGTTVTVVFPETNLQ